jgi:hypothetical protein
VLETGPPGLLELFHRGYRLAQGGAPWARWFSDVCVSAPVRRR